MCIRKLRCGTTNILFHTQTTTSKSTSTKKYIVVNCRFGFPNVQEQILAFTPAQFAKCTVNDVRTKKMMIYGNTVGVLTSTTGRNNVLTVQAPTMTTALSMTAAQFTKVKNRGDQLRDVVKLCLSTKSYDTRARLFVPVPAEYSEHYEVKCHRYYANNGEVGQDVQFMSYDHDCFLLHDGPLSEWTTTMDTILISRCKPPVSFIIRTFLHNQMLTLKHTFFKLLPS